MEVMDEAGKVLARRRLPKGPAGMARLHALVGGLAGEDEADAEVAVGIETGGRTQRAAALVAAGYLAFAVNPLQAARFRDRHGVSSRRERRRGRACPGSEWSAPTPASCSSRGRQPAGRGGESAGPDAQDADLGADPAGAAAAAPAAGLLPAALEAFGEDLDAPDALELLAKAPDPDRARRLTRAQVAAALRRARRRNIEARTGAVIAALRGEQLGQPAALAAAYAATVRALITVTTAPERAAVELEGQAAEQLAGTRTLRSTCPSPAWDPSSPPGCSRSYGDDQRRYASAKAAGTPAAPAP